MNRNLSDDLIWGADAIAKEVGLSRRQAYYMLDRGLLPAGQQGEKWVASRAALKAHFDQLMSGAKMNKKRA